MAVSRLEKLNSEFKKEIYEVISTRVKDPNITEMFSIMEVICDRELATAKVFVSVFSTNPDKAKATFNAIVNSASFVRQQISRSMHIRTVPQFIFLPDNSMEYSQKINNILAEINK